MGQHRIVGPRLRRITALLGIALLSAASMLVAVPAAAQQTPQLGQVRLGHLSPSTPAVDIYLTAAGEAPSREPLVQDAGYGAVTPYQDLAPGRYTVEMRSAGAAPDSAAPLSSAIEVTMGSAQSLLFFDTGASGTVQGQLVTDDLTAAQAGLGRVRIVQGAADTAVEMQAVGGPRLATALEYGTVTDYAAVGAREWTVAIAAGDREQETTLDVADGSVSTVVLTREPTGALAVTPLVDVVGSVPNSATPGVPQLTDPPVASPNEEAPPAEAPNTVAPNTVDPAEQQMPQGGVPAGGGATAGSVDPAPVLLALAGGVLLVFAIAGRPLGRSRRS